MNIINIENNYAAIRHQQNEIYTAKFNLNKSRLTMFVVYVNNCENWMLLM